MHALGRRWAAGFRSPLSAGEGAATRRSARREMTTQQPAQIVTSFGPTTAGATRGLLDRWFFVAFAALAIIIVAVGFAPTYYLRAFGTEALPPELRVLPFYLHLHGVALTLWFLLYFVQAMLVATGRRDWHRSLGVVGLIVGVAVIVTTSIALLQQESVSPVRPALLPVPFFLNLGGVLETAVRLACGVHFRRRPEVHKRLMYLTGVPLLGAALSRVPGAIPFVPLLPLGLLLALTIRDLALTRRVHPATVWGGLVLTLVIGAMSVALGQSALGHAIVDALRKPG